MVAPVFHLAPIGSIEGRVDFLSGVLVAYSAEQRLRLRLRPRLELGLDFDLFGDRIEQARFLARAAGAGRLAVPDWRFYTFADLVEAQTVVAVGDMAPLYAVGADVIATDGDDAVHVTTVASKAGGDVTLADALPADMPGAFVAPLLEGAVRGGLAIDPRGYGYARASLELIVDSYVDLSAAFSAALTFEGHEVFTAHKYRVGEVRETLLRPAVFVDNGTGPIAVEPTREHFEGLLSLAVEDDEPAAVLAREGFFHRLRGRVKPFFLATDTRDLAPLADLGGTTVSATARGAAADYIGRRFLVRRKSTSTVTPLAVTAADVLDGVATLTVSPPLPAIALADVSIVAEMSLVRLDADRVTFRFDAARGAVASVTAERIDYEL
jgi:hypothetical protein